jgi:hypothetical protein
MGAVTDCILWMSKEACMNESIIAGTELKLTAWIDSDGVLSIKWDRMPTVFLFHDGYAAILKYGSGDAEGMVELQRVRVDIDMNCAGHVEPLLSSSA